MEPMLWSRQKKADSGKPRIQRFYGDRCVIYKSDMKPIPGYVPPPSVYVPPETDKQEQRIETLEEEVRTLRREVVQLREMAGRNADTADGTGNG